MWAERGGWGLRIGKEEKRKRGGRGLGGGGGWGCRGVRAAGVRALRACVRVRARLRASHQCIANRTSSTATWRRRACPATCA